MIAQVKDEIEMLNRHFTILQLVSQHEPIGIVSLSKETGYPQHKVRYSLRILEEENLIQPTNNGAITTGTPAVSVNEASDRIEELISNLEGLKTRTRAVDAQS